MGEIKKSSELPATQKMLYGVRDELKSDISTLRNEMKAGFREIHAKFDSRFERLQASIDKQNAKLDRQDAKFHRMLTLYEEQEGRNKYVLDGYASIDDRLERLERKYK